MQQSTILICHGKPSENDPIGNSLNFHEDDPKHTANAVKANLDRKTPSGTLSVMD